MPQRVLVGTSGYNYPEWRGTFYPEKFSTDKMLAYYAERFPTVEINYTFYRMPNEKLLAGWSAGTPEHFSFTLKAPRRITHDAKLQRCEDLTQTFCRTAQTLGPKLGMLLFQLPPTFKKDVAVLRDFLELLPEGIRAAFEFRHPSWHDPAVFADLRAPQRRALRRRQREDEHARGVTADYAYFRLRDEGYQQADIERWAATIARVAGRHGRLRLLQARGAGAGPRVRAAVDRGPAPGARTGAATPGLTPVRLIASGSRPENLTTRARRLGEISRLYRLTLICPFIARAFCLLP